MVTGMDPEEETMDETVQSLRRHKVMIIYRGFSPAECRDLTGVLCAAGLRLFEVTLNSAAALESISLLRAEFGERITVGAGTVLEETEVKQAAGAGASFIVSPDVSEPVIAATKQAGLASVPGAFTPTEILRAVRAGADLVKVFPIRPVGAGYIRQLRGPLPDVGLVATGGVDADLARECFAEGCAGVGVGAHLLGARPGAAPGDEDIVRQAGKLLAAATPADDGGPGAGKGR
jgi:2-dehydro-3-deoxyphosphogluconate aldolase / (4S)-4-hydroxy-2-oxoglutarate aldolase